MEKTYLHGYSEQEADRLKQQSLYLEALVYEGIDIAPGSLVLEPGCGVGGQTAVLLKRYPDIRIHGVETEALSVQKAKENLHLAIRDKKVELFHSDLTLYTATPAYDAAFICWVLEHVENPKNFLAHAYRFLKPGGQIIITEVFNDSLFLSPVYPAVQHYWRRFNEWQLKNKGNPNAGAYAGNWLQTAGFTQIKSIVKTHFYDATRPAQRNSMLNYWFDLLNSAALQMQENNFVSGQELLDFRQQWVQYSQQPEAVFYYSFIQYFAVK